MKANSAMKATSHKKPIAVALLAAAACLLQDCHALIGHRNNHHIHHSRARTTANTIVQNPPVFLGTFFSSGIRDNAKNNVGVVSPLKTRGGDNAEEGDDDSNKRRKNAKSSKIDKLDNNITIASESNDDNNDDDDDDDDEAAQREIQMKQNASYIKGLLENLEGVTDKWITTGTMATRRRAYNILQQITRLSMDTQLIDQATRLLKRSGMPMEEPEPLAPTIHIPADQQQLSGTGGGATSSCGGGVSLQTGETSPRSTTLSSPPAASASSSSSSSSSSSPTTYTDTSGSTRKLTADERLQWEKQHLTKDAFMSRMIQDELVGGATTPPPKNNTPPNSTTNPSNTPRSALSARGSSDPFMNNVVEGNEDIVSGLDPFSFANDKKELQDTLGEESSSPPPPPQGDNASTRTTDFASAKASELIARAGSGTAFQGSALGIGGLDDVLSQIQRRVWIPLAAPPSLLSELGIQPVRGLLLYGSPGCGKTLLARKLGSILSPARPITIVSGPEILDKFVGSSEKNLREIFDNPPELYFDYKKNYGDPLDKMALHVIILDEFDAIARSRGGAGGKGDQGDAGVARDSVVNQLLAKMDGIDGLGVPTLLIGLTNQPWLIDPALMRPGRFEVQIEVPKPRTVEQRVSILKVHTDSMMRSGRVLAKDAPEGSAAWRRLQVLEAIGAEAILTYAELLDLLAVECDGMSGASLAGVARAAASRALERAVTDFAGHVPLDSMNSDDMQLSGSSISDCLVTQEDFEKAIEDVFESARGGDREFFSKDSVESKNGNTSDDKESNKNNSSDGDVSIDDTIVNEDTSNEDNYDLEGSGDVDAGANSESTNEESVISEGMSNSNPAIPSDEEKMQSEPGTFKSSNLKSLLPTRKITWKKLDKLGRRIEDFRSCTSHQKRRPLGTKSTKTTTTTIQTFAFASNEQPSDTSTEFGRVFTNAKLIHEPVTSPHQIQTPMTASQAAAQDTEIKVRCRGKR